MLGEPTERDLVVSCYFTRKADPLRGQRWRPDDDEKVRTWCESLLACGMRGLILHDACPDDFVAKWTSTQIEWRKVEWLSNWSTNAERFRQYPQIVQQSPGVERWLFTDLSDVEFYRNPFELFADPDVLYIQTEPGPIGANEWMQAQRIAAFRKQAQPDHAPVYNAGLFGGYRDTVLSFLRDVEIRLRSTEKCWLGDEKHRRDAALGQLRDTKGRLAHLPAGVREHLKDTARKWDAYGINADMAAVCQVARTRRVVTGHPLHTRFRALEPREGGAYVRHK